MAQESTLEDEERRVGDENVFDHSGSIWVSLFCFFFIPSDERKGVEQVFSMMLRKILESSA